MTKTLKKAMIGIPSLHGRENESTCFLSDSLYKNIPRKN